MIEFTEEDRKQLKRIAHDLETGYFRGRETVVAGLAERYASSLRQLAERPAGDAEGLREKLEVLLRSQEAAKAALRLIDSDWPSFVSPMSRADMDALVNVREAVGAAVDYAFAALDDQTQSQPAGDAGLREWLRSDEAREKAIAAVEPLLVGCLPGRTQALEQQVEAILAALADSTEGRA